jgi:hypothetical protein
MIANKVVVQFIMRIALVGRTGELLRMLPPKQLLHVPAR